MKLIKVSKLLVLGLIVTITAIGCKSSPTGVTHIPDRDKNLTGSGSTADNNNIPAAPTIGSDDKVKADPTTGLFPETHPPRGNWNADSTVFKDFTVHFEYDSSTIRASEKSHLEAVANQLKTAPTSVALRVEGHCDERGTEEYNRSLGERRALALREELIRLGVAADRIDTISYGEDKPAVIGHDESAFKQNRRGEFVQLTEPAR